MKLRKSHLNLQKTKKDEGSDFDEDLAKYIKANPEEPKSTDKKSGKSKSKSKSKSKTKDADESEKSSKSSKTKKPTTVSFYTQKMDYTPSEEEKDMQIKLSIKEMFSILIATRSETKSANDFIQNVIKKLFQFEEEDDEEDEEEEIEKSESSESEEEEKPKEPKKIKDDDSSSSKDKKRIKSYKN